MPSVDDGAVAGNCARDNSQGNGHNDAEKGDGDIEEENPEDYNDDDVVNSSSSSSLFDDDDDNNDGNSEAVSSACS